jgi:hypothetical protein
MTITNKVNNWVGGGLIPKLFVLQPADIFNGFASPPILIPAPGTNLIICPTLVHIWLKFNSVAYTGGGAPRLSVGTSNSSFTATTITASVDTWQGIQIAGSLIANVNQPLTFSNATAPFALGDSLLYIYLQYRLARIG